MNQQFNYALFRNFSHHIALGKVSPLLYLYISKNAQTLKGSLPNPILQSLPPAGPSPPKWNHSAHVFVHSPLEAEEMGLGEPNVQTGLGLLIFSGSGASWLGYNHAKSSVFTCDTLKRKKQPQNNLKGVSANCNHCHIAMILRGGDRKRTRLYTFFFPQYLLLMLFLILLFFSVLQPVLSFEAG